MPQPDLDSFTKRGVLIAPAGTSLDPGLHAVQLLDGKSSTKADESERNIDRAFLTNTGSTFSNHAAMIEGRLELLPPVAPGHATDGIPIAAAALYPCALELELDPLARTSALVPISSNYDYADANWYHAGTLLGPRNIMGDLSDLRMEIGKAHSAQVKLDGLYDAETQVALPDIDVGDWVQPRIATYENSDVRVDSLGAAAISNQGLLAQYFAISFGQTPTTIELTNQYRKTDVNERKGTFELLYARPDLDEFNARALMRSHEYIRVRWKLREPDGRYTEQFARGQITAVSDENYKGKRFVKISGKCIGDVPGEDYGVVWGDDTFALNGSISNGTEEVVYVANGLTASGLYTAPLTWDISVGALPSGLTINTATGVISGTPADGTAGTINVTVRATDSTPGTALVATKAVSFTIAA